MCVCEGVCGYMSILGKRDLPPTEGGRSMFLPSSESGEKLTEIATRRQILSPKKGRTIFSVTQKTYYRRLLRLMETSNGVVVNRFLVGTDKHVKDSSVEREPSFFMFYVFHLFMFVPLSSN